MLVQSRFNAFYKHTSIWKTLTAYRGGGSYVLGSESSESRLDCEWRLFLFDWNTIPLSSGAAARESCLWCRSRRYKGVASLNSTAMDLTSNQLTSRVGTCFYCTSKIWTRHDDAPSNGGGGMDIQIDGEREGERERFQEEHKKSLVRMNHCLRVFTSYRLTSVCLAIKKLFDRTGPSCYAKKFFGD